MRMFVFRRVAPCQASQCGLLGRVAPCHASQCESLEAAFDAGWADFELMQARAEAAGRELDQAAPRWQAFLHKPAVERQRRALDEAVAASPCALHDSARVKSKRNEHATRWLTARLTSPELLMSDGEVRTWARWWFGYGVVPLRAEAGPLPSRREWMHAGAPIPAFPCRLYAQTGARCEHLLDGIAEHVMLCNKSQSWNGHHVLKDWIARLLRHQLRLEARTEQEVPELFADGVEARLDVLIEGPLERILVEVKTGHTILACKRGGSTAAQLRTPCQTGDAKAARRYRLLDAAGRPRCLHAKLFAWAVNTFGALEPGGVAFIKYLREHYDAPGELSKLGYVRDVLSVQYARSQAHRLMAA